MSVIEELVQFLAIETRLDVKSLALQQVLNLTGTAEGRQLLINDPNICKKVCLLLNDTQHAVAKDASLVLVNFSSDEDLIVYLLSPEMEIVRLVSEMIMDPNHQLADPACMVLSNLTRNYSGSETVFKILSPKFETFIDIFCNEKFNQHGAKLHYLGAVISNLSQLPEMREYGISIVKIVQINYICI